MYSQQYYPNNTQYSRSSYNLQQYTVQPRSHIPPQPQLGVPQRSQSHSNLRNYFYSQNSNVNSGGIVLQSLNQNTAAANTHMTHTHARMPVCENNMNANLATFAKYSQLQLQQAMSQYPQWLQKEYLRRLQRQYEEMYVIEDPKIHHWSAICPRAIDAPKETIAKSEKLCVMNIIADSVHSDEHDHEHEDNQYLSDSHTLSPSPIYHRTDIEGTTSPKAHTNVTVTPISNIDITLDTGLMSGDECASKMAQRENSKMLTCFDILDIISGDEDEEFCDKKEDPLCISDIEIDEGMEQTCFDACDSEVRDNGDNSVQSPKECEVSLQQQKQVRNGYYSQQQQQYQQAVAMQRYYQQKQAAQAHYQQQLLLRQQKLIQRQQIHTQYLMQQNKYVAQYVNQNQNQYSQAPNQNQNMSQMYYQNANQSVPYKHYRA